MNPNLRSLSLLSIGLVLSLGPARAQDSSNPPVPPPAPAPSDSPPADGGQGQRHRHMREGYVLSDLTAKLSLTAGQQKTVGGILANTRTQTKELRGDDSLSKDDRRAKIKEIMSTTRGQIRAALTPDQQKLFDALPVSTKRPPPGAPPPPPPAADAPPAPPPANN